MALLGIVLILAFVFTLFYFEYCEKQQKRKNYTDSIERESEETRKRDEAQERYQLELQKRNEERKIIEIEEKKFKIALFSLVLDKLRDEFISERNLLKERYKKIHFDFCNKQLIEKFIRLGAIEEGNQINVNQIFKEISVFNYKNNSPIWNKISPLQIRISNDKECQEIDLPENWNEIRKVCFDRDKMTCQRCGLYLIQSIFHVHHIVPRSRNGNHDFENLITLCVDCHSLQGGKHEQLIRDKSDIDFYLENLLKKKKIFYLSKNDIETNQSFKVDSLKLAD